MEYKIQELSTLAGVTSRTLRYYDSIGLLKPLRVNDAGYRIYGSKEVDLLQQILFYRELDVPLSEISRLLPNPNIDHSEALLNHRDSLLREKLRLERLIETLDKSIGANEGRITMSDKEKFEGFKKALIDENEKKYGEEIRQKYGDETVDESNRKMMNLSKDDYDKMQALANEINSRLEDAVGKGVSPESDTGQEIAAMHKEWLSFSWAEYSPEAHCGLAEMYVADERFRKYYDGNVDGCAEFLRDAINAFV